MRINGMFCSVDGSMVGESIDLRKGDSWYFTALWASRVTKAERSDLHQRCTESTMVAVRLSAPNLDGRALVGQGKLTQVDQDGFTWSGNLEPWPISDVT